MHYDDLFTKRQCSMQSRKTNPEKSDDARSDYIGSGSDRKV